MYEMPEKTGDEITLNPDELIDETTKEPTFELSDDEWLDGYISSQNSRGEKTKKNDPQRLWIS